MFEIPTGDRLYFVSPEDLVLNKLHWRKQSPSEKQWRDVLGVLKVQGQSLDFGYLLDLTADLSQAMTEAGMV